MVLSQPDQMWSQTPLSQQAIDLGGMLSPIDKEMQILSPSLGGMSALNGPTAVRQNHGLQSMLD